MDDPTNKYASAARDANEALIARLKRERDAAYESLVRSERDFKNLHAEYANAVGTLERVSKQIDTHAERLGEFKRAVALASPIIEALAIVLFDGVGALARDEEFDRLGEVKVGSMLRELYTLDKPLNENDHALNNITLGEVEIAAGCLMQGILR